MKKPNLIYSNFLSALKDLKKIKFYFLFVLIFFFLITFIGLIFPIFFEEKILNLLKELVSKTESLGFIKLSSFIIANNIKSAFLGMILGIFLSIPPIIILITNAYVLGFVANKISSIEGFTILWRLLPHGIFEIPSILISLSLGLWIGSFFLSHKYSLKRTAYFLISLTLMIGFSFILLFILAVLILFISNTSIENFEMFDIIDNPLTSLIIFILFILSFLIGSSILDNKDKIELSYKIFTSLRIFILIVIPLLVIAGFIEGLLIRFLG